MRLLFHANIASHGSTMAYIIFTNQKGQKENMEFEKFDLNELDRDLSDEQQKEWNAIYASYRSSSILTGKVAGMDTTVLTLTNKETGEPERREINCLVVIGYRVKILIPEQEIWYNEQTKRPNHVLRSMVGATIDYVITNIDREGECCTASRRMALMIRRRSFLRSLPKEGAKTRTTVLAVGRTHLLATVNGFDLTLSQRDLSYAMLPDLRERYHPGETYPAVIKQCDAESEQLTILMRNSISAIRSS